MYWYTDEVVHNDNVISNYSPINRGITRFRAPLKKQIIEFIERYFMSADYLSLCIDDTAKILGVSSNYLSDCIFNYELVNDHLMYSSLKIFNSSPINLNYLKEIK